MKSTVVNLCGSNNVIQFPVIARLKEEHNGVVLFSDFCVGTILCTIDDWGPVGEVSSRWTSVSDASVWEILPEVTINFKL